MEDMVKKKTFWKGRRVLVTGGSGFVGYWLASTLVERGARVTVLDIKKLPRFKVLDKNYGSKIHFVKGNVASAQTIQTILKKDKTQTIFHLAAEAIVARSKANPARTLDTNVRGTWTVLEAARHAPQIQEIVVASSDKAYGVQSKLPYLESASLSGKYPYDCSKSCTDLIAQMYAYTYDLPVTIARCGNIYGGGDMNGSRLIPDALRHIYKKQVFNIRSNGKFLRDYVYIADAVHAYMTLAEQVAKKKLASQAFNFAHNEPLSVLEVIKKLQNASDHGLQYEVLNQGKHEIPEQYLDSSKARRVLGWRPATAIDRGLKQTIAWYDHFFTNGGTLAQ